MYSTNLALSRLISERLNTRALEKSTRVPPAAFA
jgi:hypothetical protein